MSEKIIDVKNEMLVDRIVMRLVFDADIADEIAEIAILKATDKNCFGSGMFFTIY